MTTVGSPGHHRPMTRDEPERPGLPGLSADMVMQSFCHTAAYPKPGGREMHREPAGLHQRTVAAFRCVRVTASSTWLNRLLLPDTVGTGGDSHTRFPIGISFPPARAWWPSAAATGVMPLDMPESVLCASGQDAARHHLRDLVHAIPCTPSRPAC